MPNTLAHFGAQGFLTRTVLPKADLKIIFLGCLLPDVPWIFTRIVKLLPLDVNLYSLRAYAIVQSSLFLTLFLCSALAVLSVHTFKVFGILAANVVMHLSLDALQTKWANGVHFFLPASWKLLNFELFWPESLITYSLTLFGLMYALWLWRQALSEPPALPRWKMDRIALSSFFLVVYLVLPVVFLKGPLVADNHFIKTLQAKTERVGKHIEFDRTLYIKGEDGDYTKSFARETIQLLNSNGTRSGVASLRGKFVTPNTIRVDEFHEHVWGFRDGSSYIGIALLVSMWGGAWVLQWKASKTGIQNTPNSTL